MTKKKPRNYGKELGGRPFAITPDKVNQLKAAFANGLTIDQACVYAKISKPAYYNYLEAHDGFADEIDAVRKSVEIQAKFNIVKKIKEGEYEPSKFWLTTKCKDEFSTRTESTGKDGEAIKTEAEVNHLGIKEVLALLEKARD